MKRVIVIEDEPNIVESLRFILNQAGYEVAVATDGDAAISLLEKIEASVVVLDVMLPKRNGFEVLKWIRDSAQLKTLPVLILSAKGQQQDQRTAEALGVDAFITKPFANRDVVDCINRLSEQRANSSE